MSNVNTTGGIEIAKRIRFLRQHYNMARETLANKAGITVNDINKLETGFNRPAITILKIANAFGASLDWILHGKVSESKAEAPKCKK